MNSREPLTADYLKRQANRLKKGKGIPHHAALDEVSKVYNYANWRHFLNAQSSSMVSQRGESVAGGSLVCPRCSQRKLAVYAVVTGPETIPLVSMKWLPIEEHVDGITLSRITQIWGAKSDMKCMSCNFEGVGSQFGFTGDELNLNPAPATHGLFPLQRFLQATARLGDDGTIFYSQGPHIQERPLRSDEVERQLRANGAYPENIEQFMSTLKTLGAADFNQRQDSHKIFAG